MTFEAKSAAIAKRIGWVRMVGKHAMRFDGRNNQAKEAPENILNDVYDAQSQALDIKF